MSAITVGRRGFLASAGALAALAGTVPPGLGAGDHLGDIAGSKGILFGSWARGSSLASIPRYTALIEQECRVIVSGVEMQWRAVAPTPSVTDFSKVDWIRAWSTARGIRFRGHALVWHGQVPPWFAELPDRAAAIGALQDHVDTMCRHFAGRMHSWDVVNEAILTSSGRPDLLRDTVFVEKIGPEFLDIAFRTARAADPHALLVYNDFDLELDISYQAVKRRILLNMVDGFRRRGVPIDAIGIQSHLATGRMAHFNEKVFGQFLRELADRGLAIMLTEMDVVDHDSPAATVPRDDQVAATYKRYLEAALDCSAVRTVITWGLTDADSWITRGDMPAFRRPDGLPPRPLPFDSDYRPKSAYWAIAEALRGARPR